MPEINVNLLEPQQIQQKKRRYWLWIGLAIFFLIAATIISAMLFVGEPSDANQANLEKPGILRQIKNLILSSDRQLKGEKDDRINTLLLGMGGAGHDGAFLTDTIILISLKPSTNKIALLSIPRDLLAEIPGYGFRRINEANAIGELQTPGQGAELAKKVVEQTIGLPIHYTVRVDFDGFIKVIDELGGVDVYVDRTFTDTQFPAPNYKFQTISFEKGWKKMDGQTALDYARSRHGSNGEGNDFDRGRRQQKILAALKEKAFSFSTFFNLGRLQNIFENFNAHLQADLELWEISRFYKMAKNLDYENMISRVLAAGTEQNPLVETNYGGAAVLAPRAGNYDEIKRLANNLFDISLTKTTQNTIAKKPTIPTGPRIQIQNGTWFLGLAALTKTDLEQKGIIIDSVANAKQRNYEKTIIYDFSQGKYAAAADKLSKELNAEISANAPVDISEEPMPDILIIIGKDKAQSSNAQLIKTNAIL
ncbi:MAG: LCP family protein [Candidatus Magasanikbacteria bacterium]|nr:LCP family protein [Candidatus Magasanikbacteria bacterium]